MTSTLLNDYLSEWLYLAQVFRVEHIPYYDQMTRFRREISYGITCLTPENANPNKLLKLIRTYWGIEGGLHYRRDVTLQEDRTRLTVGDAGQNMAILNNPVIALCLLSGRKNLASARRFLNAFPDRALRLLIPAEIPSL